MPGIIALGSQTVEPLFHGAARSTRRRRPLSATRLRQVYARSAEMLSQLDVGDVATAPGYPPGPPPQCVRPRRRFKAAVIAIVATVVTVLLCGAFGLGGFLLSGRSATGTSTMPATPSPSPRPSATRAGSVHTVAYEVTGAGSAIITFGSSNGISQDQAKLPWHKEVTVQQNNFVVSVLAFALGGQKLTCKVLVDGKQVAGATSDTAVACTQLITG
jgi:hypothetical protein